MLFKKIKVFFSLLLFFSLNGFSQTDQSAHPLLDKYYPQAKKDTSRTIVNENIQPPAPKPEVFPAPAAQRTPPASPPIETPTVEAVSTPTVTTSPTKASITSTKNGNTTIIEKMQPLERPEPAIIKDSSSVVITPPGLPVKIPAKETLQPRSPAPPPYMDTRLGSSTKQYDTYEKNSNGAGSVTTSPK